MAATPTANPAAADVSAAPAPATAAPAPAAGAPAVRWFGRLQLLRLLGKSERSSVWRVEDSRTRQELLMVLPRAQPKNAQALDRWLEVVHRGARLNHPQLAAAVDIGVQDGWPFAVYDPRDGATLAEKMSSKGLPGLDAAALLIQVMQGMAFAHDSGVAHHDLQAFHLLMGENGQIRLAGLGVAAEMASREGDGTGASLMEAGGLRSHREAAERDVLSGGILLHQILTGHKPLDEADIGRVIARLPPAGREMMRLPFATAHPIPEPLRAIANRATDRQPRQRYRNARTLMQALEGWQATESGSGGGTLELLTERVRTGGVMPSSPGSAGRAARLALMARQHTSELAEVVLEDPALSFELLRVVNLAQARNSRFGSGEPVLTVRRALAMVGLDGVRRAALSMREWPGTLGEGQSPASGELLRLIDRCKRAGRVAQALRPPGYDAEVVYLVALMQNLGRLLVHYHFADEAQQIRKLMQPAPASKAGEPDEPGMTEEGAAFAVLGADIEAIGANVAKQWGLEESVLTMFRRLPLNGIVHNAVSDYEHLRTVAGCANEAVDALALPATRVSAALQRVLQRYGRMLNIGPRDLHEALQAASTGTAEPVPPGSAGTATAATSAGAASAAKPAAKPAAPRAAS
jgi:HD-like signal output (HDOD) protein